MRCGSGLEIELREIQVVNVWDTSPSPNGCRLEVAIETAAPAEQRESGLSCECREEAVPPQATLLTETLVGAAMSAYG